MDDARYIARFDRADESLREVILALEQVRTRGDELERRLDGAGESVREVVAALEHVRCRVDELERRLQPLVNSMSVLPFMEDAGLDHFDEGPTGRVLGFRGNTTAGADRYRAFADVFRGSEDRIRALLEPYVPVLGGREPVLDLGCGRGEMLDLLRDHGIAATGVDLDAGMVERCRAKGHEAHEVDAVSALEAAGERSLGVVFASHVIEHLPYARLEALLAAALRALRPGGLLIAETVNPHAPDAMKGFWLDPTHEHPLFPEVMLVLCRTAGFASGYVFHPGGSGDVEADRFTAPVYAVVAARDS